MKTLILKLWDTPGGETYKHLRDIDYANAEVVILVYSIDKDSTLEDLGDFLKDAQTFNKNRKLKVFLIGNKSDLDAKGMRQVERSEAREWGRANGVS